MGMPTLRRPGWAKDLRRKKADEDIPDQITIIKKGNGEIPQPITGRGESRYTGTGPDRTLQPRKYAGDLHEGELVFSANATQAMPPDVRQELTRQAEDGSLDINALRQALKISPQPGYATGTFGGAASAADDDLKRPRQITTNMQPVVQPLVVPKNQPAVTPVRDTTNQFQSSGGATESNGTADSNFNTGNPTGDNTVVEKNPTIVAKPRTITSNTPEPIVQPIGVPNTPNQQTPVQPRTTETPQPIIQPIRTGEQAGGTEPQEFNPVTDRESRIRNYGAGIEAANQKTIAEQNQQPVIQQPPAPSRYQTGYDQSLTRLQDVATGNSEVDRNIANRNLRLYDTGAAQDVAQADLEATRLQNVPESARSALMAESRSAARGGRSELIGQLSQNEQERAYQANQAAANLSMAGMQFEEDKKRYGNEQTWKAYDAAIAAGDFDTAAKQYQTITGKSISMDQMKTYQNYINAKNQQSLTAGDIANDAARLGVTSARMQSIINDINNGVPVATINSTYGTSFDQATYDSMAAKYKQGIQATDLSLQGAALELASMKQSKAGVDFSSYVTNNPNANMSDPSLRNAAQAYWESTGNTGPVPEQWANERIKAIRDAGNAITKFNNDIDYAVSQGQLKPEEAALLKDINSKGILQFYKRDANGNVVFDYEALAKATGTGTGTGTTTPGTSTINGVSVTKPSGKEIGDLFEQDGKIYRVDSDGNPEAVIPKELTWEDIAGQNLGTDSAAYKAVLSNTKKLDLQYKSDALTDSWKMAPEVGQVVKATVGGKEVLLKTTYKGNQDVKLGFDNAYIEFEDMDGNKYYAGGKYKDATIRPGTGRGSTISSGQDIGATTNVSRGAISSVPNPILDIAGNFVSKYKFW
jgi:hypothetical protein